MQGGQPCQWMPQQLKSSYWLQAASSEHTAEDLTFWCLSEYEWRMKALTTVSGVHAK